MKNLEILFARKYPASVCWVDEGGGEGYFFAYLPDFGYGACNALGNTESEALAELESVKREIIQHYLETDQSIPEPSLPPFEDTPHRCNRCPFG